VAGKTGTAQVVRLRHTEDLEEDEIPVHFRDHAWFVGFAPAPAPEIVVVALVEHGGHGGSAAAPITQRVLSVYFEKKATASGPVQQADAGRAVTAAPGVGRDARGVDVVRY
jgi:penicillin-binding protein 2